MYKQVDALRRDGEPEAAHACLSPLPATQNAGEPCGPEMEARDLSSLERKYVPEGETELTEGYDRVGLDGAEPRGRMQDWPLKCPEQGLHFASPWPLLSCLWAHAKGGNEHPTLHLQSCRKVAGVNKSARSGGTG